MASPLTTANPLPGDGETLLDEATHIYTHQGVRVPISGTGVLKKYFPQFDGDSVVEKNFDKWREDPESKYFQMINYLRLVQHMTDEQIKHEITKLWKSKGREAAERGTAVHFQLQSFLECSVHGPDDTPGWSFDETVEVEQFRPWLRQFCKVSDLFPFRSEWSICHTVKSGSSHVPVLAGQVDFLLKHNSLNKYVAVDFKTTDPTPKFKNGPLNLIKETTNPGRFDEYAKAPFEDLIANDFTKYSVQLNIYAFIAYANYGVDFRNDMYVLQIHPLLKHPHLVKCANLQDRIAAVFAVEEEAALMLHSSLPAVM